MAMSILVTALVPKSTTVSKWFLNMYTISSFGSYMNVTLLLRSGAYFLYPQIEAGLVTALNNWAQ